MATPITTIHIVHDAVGTTQSIVNDLISTSGNTTLNRLVSMLSAIMAGVRNAKLVISVQDATVGVFASATITITFANITADETIVIAGKTLTWKAAAADENEVTIGADLAAATTNLTAAINAHSVLSQFVSATGVTATGVVTVTSRLPGLAGTLLTLAETGDAVVVSAAALGGVTATTVQAVTTINKGVA